MGMFTNDTEFKTSVANISALTACGIHAEYEAMDYEVIIGDLEDE